MTQFVVVGAGPAGCSAALKAARIPDVQVKVLEKRSFESVFSARNNPRSFPMVLSGRALGLFDDLELDLPSTREPYYGIEFLPSKGSLKFPSASLKIQTIPKVATDSETVIAPQVLSIPSLVLCLLHLLCGPGSLSPQRSSKNHHSTVQQHTPT